ncbi:multiple sugar transport system substrate-binding protein [Curtobacterium sp. 314Chir4.1]|uniref:ABC transporter substrate-binding protein n=1 Tax=Curtobacterium sp. 314Chir4.1 TaxID=1279028 RepID=UPI000BD751D1|nr:ABC transporter substrate-binding protein [Curtobacterium sp. 314Chir4.1]SOC89814.1 multiple sugar transport system substrate-binding protein [Curtobacterium sp. 314Chir4.1]
MTTSRPGRITAAAALLLTATVALTACSASPKDGSGGDSKTITVWSEENQPDRVAETKRIIAGFTDETGIRVKLVPVDENQVPQLTASAAISGDLPDVMGAIPLSLVRQFDTQDLLDTAASANIVRSLGADTFVDSALALDQDGDRQLAVPDSSYAQILVYRKDLFEQAGLAPPTTYSAIKKAADVLTKRGQYGITLATDPADVFTQQTFESLALGNDCQLVRSSGKVALESTACQATWDLYGHLTAKDSPQGTQTVDTTRAAYFAGQAAMVDWSTYILDELGGLRNDALPTCPRCRDDRKWLAEHSGVVTAISGPDGSDPATYGEATSWAVMHGANRSASEQFVQYMMSTGYEQWLGMAPEGKIPLRTGTASEPDRYQQAWLRMKAGVDRKERLDDIYDASTMRALESVPKSIRRWAIPQGQGALLGPFNAQLPVGKSVADLASGSTTPRDAAKTAQDAVEEIEAKTR